MAGYSICLIGNSHLAALAQAWRKDRLGARPEVSLIYFGLRGGHDWELSLEDGVLVPTDEEGREAFRRSSGGRTSIAIRDYDAFVLYGVGFRLGNILPLFLEHGTVADLKWGPIGHLISEDCFSAALQAAMSAATALKLVKQVRAVSQAPAIVCPMPYRAETGFRRSYLASHKRLSQAEYLAHVAGRFTAAAAALCARDGAEFVPQDESTCGLPCFTKAEFLLGGTNWKAERKKKEARETRDDKHMNARYGAIMLRNILRRLDEVSGGGVLETERAAASAEAVLEAAE